MSSDVLFGSINRFWSCDWNRRNLRKNLVFDQLASFPADQWKLVSMWTKRVCPSGESNFRWTEVLLWVLSVTHHWVCHCRNVQDGITGRKINTYQWSIIRAALRACWNTFMESDGSVSFRLHTNSAAQPSVNRVWVFTSRAAPTQTRSVPAGSRWITDLNSVRPPHNFHNFPPRPPRAERAERAERAGSEPGRAAPARCGLMRV